MWFGTNDGLNKFDGTYLKYTNYQNNPDIEGSLSDNSVSSLYQDKWGDIWVGTYGKGVNYYNRRLKKFETYRQNLNCSNMTGINQVNCFLEKDGFLWVGTENGLNKIDKSTGKIQFFRNNTSDKNSIGANAIYSLYCDTYDNLWIGTWAGGLNLYNKKNNSFTKFTFNDSKVKSSIGSNSIFSILQDSRKNLWIGTMGGGLNLFDYKTLSFKKYLRKNDSISISYDYINVIFESKKGILYVSTYSDLNIFHYEDETFSKVKLNHNNDPEFIKANIKVIFQDSKENMWIGTEGGLVYYDEITNKTIQYTTNDGLPNNSIKGIVEDNNGNLWLSTNMGISKFVNGTDVPEKPEFKNYNVADGLQGNEFNKRAYYKDKNGYIYFGGTNGYTRFHPDSIFDNKIVPTVIITDFLVFNKPFVFNNKEAVPFVKLKYKENVFTIKFSSLNYLSPEKNQYAFIMEGFEKQWNYAGNQRMATYTNLSPGEYTFKVKASNNDNIWNENGASIKIEILPPWWNTIIFKIFAFLLLVLIIYSFFILRLKNLREQKFLLEENVRKRTNELSNANILLNERQEEIIAQNNELEQHRNHLEQLVKDRTTELEKAIKKAHESDKLKSAFLSNVSHEIRTPMNAIVGFSNLLSMENIDEPEKEKFISYIQSSCDSLNVLINDIVEISLIEYFGVICARHFGQNVPV